MGKKWVLALLVTFVILFLAGVIYAWHFNFNNQTADTLAVQPLNRTFGAGPAPAATVSTASSTDTAASADTSSATTSSSTSDTSPSGVSESSSTISSGSVSSVPTSTALPSADSSTSTVEAATVRLLAVGDIMLGRNVGKKLSKAPGGYDYAFGKVSDLLKQGDVVFGNLESPITASAHSLDPKKKYVLKAAPQSVEALKKGGFNLLSIANNHMLDYYSAGLFDTMAILNRNGIVHAGGGKNIGEARKPAIIERNGIKIGLVAFSDMTSITYAGTPPITHGAGINKAGVAPRDYESIKEDIDSLKGKVDIIAVSLHWGVEESFTVTPQQVEFAHKLLDDGADVILGHHPHQFQGIEIYKGKPILYSMGNFLFDQNDPENMESFIVDMTFRGNKLESLKAIPVRILDKNHVEIQTGKSAANILNREISLCSKLGTPAKAEKDVLSFNIKN